MGISQAGAGGIFSSTLPISPELSEVAGVIGMGTSRGGFFFQGDQPFEPIDGPPSGVTGLSRFGAGGIFSSTLPISPEISSTFGVVGLGIGGGGYFSHGAPVALPPPSGAGVHGVSADAAGVGVLAQNTGGGTALRVEGPVSFGRSGVATVPSGAKTVTVGGVSLSPTSAVVATSQDAGGVVAWVVTDPGGSSFDIRIQRVSTSAAVRVAWVILD